MTGPMHANLGAQHPVQALDEGHAGIHRDNFTPGTAWRLARRASQGVLVTSNVDNSLDVFSLSVTHVLVFFFFFFLYIGLIP